MLKKALVVVLGLVLLVGLLFGPSAWSYVSATVSEIRDSVKNNVPVEFELKRAKKEISKIDGDIREAMHEVAKEEVQVEKLAKQISTKEQQLAKSKSDIMTLTAHLESGEKHYVTKGRSYSGSQVEADLARRFKRFKTEEATLDNMRKTLEFRERGLNAAQETLEEMLATQKQFEVEVANLEAEQRMIEVAKASSEFSIDDSRQSSVRSLLDEIRTRQEVDKKLANADVYYADEIPVGEEAVGSGSILEEINSHFNPEDDSFVDSAR